MDLQEFIKNKKRTKGNLISIILPLYNEEQSIPFVLKELFDYLENNLKKYCFEITFVDDCSTDNSNTIILENSKVSPANVKISIARLTKNSGSHIAITAGLNIVRGDLIIIMASDGQDPALVIGQLIEEWEKGNKLILASREDNLDHGAVSKIFSRIAWRIMNWSTNINMPLSGCDLLAMDRNVVNSFNRMDERNTTFIFRVLALGYPYKELKYIKRVRNAGKSKWTFWKKISIMLDAMTGFSNRPLRLITKIGLGIFVVLLARWCYIVFKTYVLKEPPTELTIILNTVLTSLSIIILLLGVIGDYIWRILDETRKRPIYEIDEVEGEIFENSEIKNEN